MTVFLKLTTAAADTTSVPDNATVVRIKSLGTCTNYVDIVLTGGVSTTTSSSTTVVGTTTTTTTLIFLHNLSNGEFTTSASCAHTTYPIAVSANTNPITLGTVIRNYPSGTIFLGNSLYYRLQGPGSSIRILADGKVTFGGSSCP